MRHLPSLTPNFQPAHSRHPAHRHPLSGTVPVKSISNRPSPPSLQELAAPLTAPGIAAEALRSEQILREQPTYATLNEETEYPIQACNKILNLMDQGRATAKDNAQGKGPVRPHQDNALQVRKLLAQSLLGHAGEKRHHPNSNKAESPCSLITWTCGASPDWDPVRRIPSALWPDNRSTRGIVYCIWPYPTG